MTTSAWLPDLEDDERAALGALGFALDARDGDGRWPDPALYGAVAEGVLPDALGRAVERHLATCPACQDLARDLALAYDDAAGRHATPPHVRLAPPAAAPRAGAAAWTLRLGGLALAAALAWLLVVPVSPLDRPVPPRTGSVRTAAAIAPASVLAVGLPPLDLAEPELVLRAAPSGATAPGDDLSDAVALARRGEAGRAIRALERLSADDPAAPEVALALGVLLIEAGAPDRAVRRLADGRPRGGALAGEIDWALAVAHVRSGRPDLARPLLESLCAGGHEAAARACAGRDELDEP